MMKIKDPTKITNYENPIILACKAMVVTRTATYASNILLLSLIKSARKLNQEPMQLAKHPNPPSDHFSAHTFGWACH